METFTLFPTLSVELRLKIWRSTFPGPREVSVTMDVDKHSDKIMWKARKTTESPPIALQVCRESREEASRHWILSFATAENPPLVYFNYKLDVLCVEIGSACLHGHDGPERDLMGMHEADPNTLLRLWNRIPMDVGGRPGPDPGSKAVLAKTIRYIYFEVSAWSNYHSEFLWWDEARQFEGLEEFWIIAPSPEGEGGFEVSIDRYMVAWKTALMWTQAEHPEWVVPDIRVISAEGVREGSLYPEYCMYNDDGS